MAGPSYSSTKRLSQAHTSEYSVVSQFKLGYRNREDVTNLPPGVLIVGSQNVLTNVSERVQIRQGYSVDGQVNNVNAPVLSSFDWLTRGNAERHLRAGGLTNGTDGKLQFRYQAQGGEYINLVRNGTFTGNDDGWVVGSDWTYNTNKEDYALTTGSLLPLYAGVSVNGTGYTVGDVLTATGGGNDGQVTVTEVDGSGGVVGLTLTAMGTGYLPATTYPTTGGTGTGFILDVTLIGGTPLTQAVYLQPNTTYTFSFDLSGSAAFSGVLVYAGSSFDVSSELISGGFITGDGTATFTYTGTVQNNIYIVPALSAAVSGVGSLDNVSITFPVVAGDVLWRDLMESLSSVALNFTTFWKVSENLRVALWVDGSPNIYEWNGAYTTLTSSTGNTLTKTGDTWVDSGFYAAGNKVVTINGTDYTYTAGEGTTTLTGVTPDPSAEPVGSLVVQKPITTAISSFTSGPPSTFAAGLIKVLNNQIFLGSLVSSALWISKVNDYTDYGSSTPRQTGEGATLILDSQLVALEPQENFMYVSAGQDLWYNVNFEVQTSTVGVSYEQVNALPLKTGRQQAALSQAFVSHMKNDIIVVTNEPTVDSFGRVEGVLTTPQQSNISDPIKLDMDSYDFTDGSIFYWRYFILVAIPKEGVVRIFNLNTRNWEAPQTLPISRFYIVNGELYGHSYNTFESYKLFDGYADRIYPGFTGFPIQANWKFSYENYGTRFALKKSTKMYVEGYINANTTMKATITYELDGCQVVKNFELDGSNSQFVCLVQSPGSLGKVSLGKQKLGGDTTDSIQGLPPKFRWFPTYTNTDFFENSVSFSILGTNNRMELLAFGLAVSPSSEIPTNKMD